MSAPIRTLLVANRGEIACRVFRTAQRMGIGTVAVYSDADRNAPHVRMADQTVRLGPAPATESYLLGDRIIEAARQTGADAIHPGYGFLSENAAFAQAVIGAGLVWIGPPPEAIRAMGLKDAAKRLMEAVNVPLVPGYHGERQDDATLAAEAERIGAPLMVKAAAGGGGKGMRLVEDLSEFDAALQSARREAQAAFGNSDVLIERFVTSPRHIEVQVIADSHGRTLSLGTRDCSLQRRHQKVIEEAPAPGLTPAIETAMLEAARRAGEAVGYQNAGTVEFIADGAKLAEALADGSNEVPENAFSFMEMNTRLQVEHPVTEESLGVDLVEWQLRVASGEALPDPFPPGGNRAWHSAEARLYAEDAAGGFLPATGTLHRLRFPNEGASGSDGTIRIDTGVAEGDTVSPHYDPMIAKVIGSGPTREAALGSLGQALDGTEVAGLVTNLAFLRRLIAVPDFVSARMDTGLIAREGESLTANPVAGALAWGLAAMVAGGMVPPKAHDGFRLWGRARAFVPLREGEDDRTVVITGPDEEGACVIEAGDENVTLESLDLLATENAEGGVEALHLALRAKVGTREGPASFPITSGQATVVLHPGSRSDERAVTVFGLKGARDVHTFLVPDPLQGRADTGGGDGVVAPMPGTLIALDVAVGNEVSEGQRLGVLEAMKMEHALKAPRDGTVVSLGAAVGAQVAAGDPLVMLAEASDTASGSSEEE